MNSSKKSFWSRHEGTTGMIFIILASLFGVWLASLLLPLLINAMFALGLLGAMFGIGALLLNKRFRNAGSYLFKMLMFKFTDRFIVRVDPIAVAKIALGKTEDKLDNIGDGMTQIKGKKLDLKRSLDENKSEYKALWAQAQYAKKHGQTAQFASLARQLRMLREQRTVFLNLHKQVSTLHTSLQRIHMVVKIQVEEQAFAIKTKEKQWAVTKAALSVTKDVRSILDGMEDPDNYYNRAMEYMDNMSFQADAEVEMLSELTEDLYRSVVAQDEIEMERLSALIDEQEARVMSNAGDLDLHALEDIEDVDEVGDDLDFQELAEESVLEEIEEPEYA
jgi:phage shock protein A